MMLGKMDERNSYYQEVNLSTGKFLSAKIYKSMMKKHGEVSTYFGSITL